MGFNRKDKMNYDKYYQYVDYFTDTTPCSYPIYNDTFLT